MLETTSSTPCPTLILSFPHIAFIPPELPISGHGPTLPLIGKKLLLDVSEIVCCLGQAGFPQELYIFSARYCFNHSEECCLANIILGCAKLAILLSGKNQMAANGFGSTSLMEDPPQN